MHHASANAVRKTAFFCFLPFFCNPWPAGMAGKRTKSSGGNQFAITLIIILRNCNDAQGLPPDPHGVHETYFYNILQKK